MPVAAEAAEAVAVVITAVVVWRSEAELTGLQHGLGWCALHDVVFTHHCALSAALLCSPLPPPRMSVSLAPPNLINSGRSFSAFGYIRELTLPRDLLSSRGFADRGRWI